MGTGIDPKNDYAFKRVFGNEQHTDILVHLLNAVLSLPKGLKIVAVQILNPITGKESLNEKTLILDIKARDERGRHFIIEMQMVIHPGLPNRFLLYWAKSYGRQLREGEDYTKLQPTISICFVDGFLFPHTDKWHLRFHIAEADDGTAYSDHLQIHVFQLPNFIKKAEELSTPLESWLYFLNNGDDLNPDELPESLQTPELQYATRALTMLTQDEIELAKYESREMARRDAMMWEKTIEQMQRDAEQQQRELDQKSHELDQKSHELDQKSHELDQKSHELDQKSHELAEANRQLETVRLEKLISEIQLCQLLLGQAKSTDEELFEKSIDDLQATADQLRSKLANNQES